MLEAKETRESQPERAISVGQEFNLVSHDDGIPSKNPIVRFTLRVEGLNIPIGMSIFSGVRYPHPLFITPFNLEMNDAINAKGYKPEERKRKLEELSSVDLSPEVKKNLFSLAIGQGSKPLNEAGINEKIYIPKAKPGQEGKPEKQKLLHKIKALLQRAGNYQKATTNSGNETFQYYRFPPEIRRILERLKLCLVFPNGLFFEAMPTDYMLDIGKIEFTHYYPRDFGPLPKFDVNKGEIYNVEKGYCLWVPADPDKLSQIKAKFFLMDEHPQDAPSVSQAKV